MILKTRRLPGGVGEVSAAVSSGRASEFDRTHPQTPQIRRPGCTRMVARALLTVGGADVVLRPLWVW